MRMGQLVRRCDDLLETLIFDVALKTRRRRAVAALAGALALTVAYVGSGLVMAPRGYHLSQETSCAPWFDEHAITGFHSEAGYLASRGTPEKPADLPAVRADVAQNRVTLDHVVAVAALPVLTRFTQVPNFRYTRCAGHLLVCRGMFAAEEGRGDAAVTDWLAAEKLGWAVADGGSDGAVVISAMVGIAIEASPIQRLAAHARAGAMTRGQAQRVLAVLEQRNRLVPTLYQSLAHERDVMFGIIDRWVADGRWPTDFFGDDATSVLALVLPWRTSQRGAAGAELKRTLGAGYERMLASMANRTKAPSIDELGAAICGACQSGGITSWVHWALTPFSTEVGARHVAWTALSIAMPNMDAAGRRMDRRAAERGELEQLCEAIRDGRSPSSVPVLPPEVR